jgi:hypothetical protein
MDRFVVPKAPNSSLTDELAKFVQDKDVASKKKRQSRPVWFNWSTERKKACFKMLQVFSSCNVSSLQHIHYLFLQDQGSRQ